MNCGQCEEGGEGGGGRERGTRRQAWLRQASWNEWMDEEGGKCKTKVNLNNKKPMGKKPKQWRRRNSTLAAGLRERSKGDKGNQAEDSDGWEDDGRWTTDVVGRRIFKANSITFCCRTASFVGLAPPSSTSACSFPLSPSFPSYPSLRLVFTIFTCSLFFCASLFFWFCFFRFHFTRNSQMNFAWKQKSHAKCQRKRDRGGEEKTKGAGGTLPEKVYFIFDIFSQENWNEIYLLRFPFWTTTTLFSHSLARSLIP